MIKKINITWNNDWAYDGFLYFGQRIVEMLDYTTPDIYRAPLINTNKLVDEYIDIYMNTANKNQLEAVKEEFLDSIENDVVLKFKYDNTKLDKLISMIKSKDMPIEEFNYLQKTIGHTYLDWCKEYIRFIVKKSKEKKKIESVIRCFIPELLRYGYNRDEIYHTAKKVMLDKDTNPEKALDIFLDTYNNIENSYIVYILFNQGIKDFQDMMSKTLRLDFSIDKNEEEINPDNQFIVAKVKDIKALDASGAANYAIKSIEIFLDFYQYLGNYDCSLIHKKVWVYDSKSVCRKLVVNREKYKSIEADSHMLIRQCSENLIYRLIYDAKYSLTRLIEIVKLHNKAISNNGLENGFLNFWSILEMICVSDIEGKKGDQVKNKLIPILQRDYLVEIFNDIERNLLNIFSMEEYRDFLKIIDENTSTTVESLADILLLDKYGTYVDEFVDRLVSYPVLRTRILEIRDKCHKMNDLYNMSVKYAKSVSWQISRIYRARNKIIHSGKEVRDIKDLGEILHSYVDSIVSEVLVQLSQGTLCDINNVLIDSELRRKLLYQELSKSVSFTEKEVKMLFDNKLFYIP